MQIGDAIGGIKEERAGARSFHHPHQLQVVEEWSCGVTRSAAYPSGSRSFDGR